MNIFLKLAYLFFIGSLIGWCIEVIFRRFFSSSNPERKWINPGFCTGPYLPLYGCGLCILYLIATMESLHIFKNNIVNKAMLFLTMTILMTVIEYIAGLMSLKINKVRLWDYSDQWGNIDGIICPKFSLFWGILGAIYYFFVHPHILSSLDWLGKNLAFSFFIGVFFGVFAVDAAHSLQIVSKLKKYAVDNNVVLHYEHVKQQIRRSYEENAKKYHFFRPFSTERPLSEHLKELRESLEQRRPKRK